MLLCICTKVPNWLWAQNIYLHRPTKNVKSCRMDMPVKSRAVHTLKRTWRNCFGSWMNTMFLCYLLKPPNWPHLGFWACLRTVLRNSLIKSQGTIQSSNSNILELQKLPLDGSQEIKETPLPSDGPLDFCSLDQVAMVKTSIHLLIPVIFCGPKAGKRFTKSDLEKSRWPQDGSKGLQKNINSLLPLVVMQISAIWIW